MNKIIIILFSLSWGISFAAEIDYLALSELLLKNKNYKRAGAALKNAFNDLEDEDHYYLLKGLYSLRMNKVDQAIGDLKRVSRSEFNLKKSAYLAEAYIQKNNFKLAQFWSEKIPADVTTPLSLLRLKAEIFFKRGNAKSLFDTLNVATTSNQRAGIRLTIHYLLELGLYKEASRQVFSALKLSKKNSDCISIAHLLISKEQYDQAILALEYSLVHYGHQAETLNLLASLYNQKQMSFVAGDFYRRLAYVDPSQSFLASEYLAQNGQHMQSSFVSFGIYDSGRKLSQKLGQYLQSERYDLAMSLSQSLKQNNGFSSDDVKYAMAYTYLVQGEYDRSSSLLNRIKNPKLITKSVELLKLVNECKESHWECYGTL